MWAPTMRSVWRWMLLGALLAIPTLPVAHARSPAQRRQVAQEQFERAQKLREALAGRPAMERSRPDYQRVIEAYRRVYYTDPTSPKAVASVMAVAELLKETGRAFGEEKPLRDAIGQYEFLRREYPGSRQRVDALFTIAEIYRQDLEDADQAKAGFQEFLKRYPRHRLASEARAAISTIEAEAARKREAEKQEAARAPSRVTGLRHWSTPDYTRVAIDLERQVKYEAGTLAAPNRIFFDLHGTTLPPELVGKAFDLEDGFLRRIRAAQRRGGFARIVLELRSVGEYSAYLLTNPDRLVIDVHGKPSPGRQPKTAGGAQKSAPKPKVTSKAARVRAAKPASNGGRSLIRALGLKIGRIVVDAGHGGPDTGTIGPTGLQEKDLVLDVAQRLGRLLENRLGAEVVYTREDDVFVPLETRTALANKHQADLFISIHANSSEDPEARGVETYYLNFTSSPDALEVAARENAASEKSISELQDLVKKIALKEKTEESREFAGEVQRALWNTAGRGTRHRGVKQAPFIVLIGANMPSVLAEISFLSNPADERKLKTPRYRQRIAEALYSGIAKYASGLGGLKMAKRIPEDTGQ